MREVAFLQGRLGLAVSIGIFLVSASYLQSFAAYGFNIRDEWVIPHGAIRVLAGEVPWKDFQGYAPGTYYLHAAAFALFGSKITVSRGLIVLLTACMVLLMVRVAARLIPPPFALLAGILLLIAPGVYYGRYINFLTMLNAFVFPLALGGSLGIFVVGMVAGITALFRQDTAVAVVIGAGLSLALISWQQSRGWPRVLLHRLWPLGLGAALVGLPWLIYFRLNGLLGPLFRAHLNALAGGYQKMSLPFPQLHALALEGRWGEVVVYYGPVLVIGLMAVLLVGRFLRRPLTREDIILVYLGVVAVLTFHQAFWRTSIENHVKVIAPVLLLACYLLWLGAQGVWRLYRASPRTLPVALVGSVLLATGPGLYAWQVLTYPFGFYVGSPSVLREQLQRLRLPVGRVYAPPYWGIPTAQATRYLTSHAAPGEPIFVVPFAPMFYVLADRPNPSFFEWVLPADPFIYPALEPRILADLERARPRYVVVEDFPLDGREDRRFSHYAPAVSRYIADRYALEAKFGEFQILRRRATPHP